MLDEELTLEEQKEILAKRAVTDDVTFPETILIDTVSYCNLECVMCPHKDMEREQEIMDWDLYKKIIDEIALKNPEARVWSTLMGEGLVMKNFYEVIQYAKEKGLKDVVLNTNGNLLNYKRAVRLVKAGLDAIYVGIDAYSKDTYNKVRVGGNLDKVINGVLDYKKALKKYGTEDQKLFVQLVEMEENKDEVDDFINFWRDKDVLVKIRPKSSWAGKIEVSNAKDFTERLPCWWVMSMSIASDGSVLSCANDVEASIPMGDINNQSIEEVWNGKLKEMRRHHIESNWEKLPSFCQECNDWQAGYSVYIEEE